MARTGSNVLFAALAGVAVGIGIGMLIAPARGSKTRKRIRKKIMGLAGRFEEEFSDKVDAIKSVFTSGEEDEFAGEEPGTEAEEEK